MGKGVKIKLKNQKNSASKKRAAFSTTEEICREGAETYRAQEFIFALFFIEFLSFLVNSGFIIASKSAESIGDACKYNIYTITAIFAHYCGRRIDLASSL